MKEANFIASLEADLIRGAYNSVLDFACDQLPNDESPHFMQAWREGGFSEIQKEWPEFDFLATFLAMPSHPFFRNARLINPVSGYDRNKPENGMPTCYFWKTKGGKPYLLFEKTLRKNGRIVLKINQGISLRTDDDLRVASYLLYKHKVQEPLTRLFPEQAEKYRLELIVTN